MKKGFYFLLGFLAILTVPGIVRAQGQGNVTFVLNQQPCNNNGIITATMTGVTLPVNITWHLAGGVNITHSNVNSYTDVLTGYSGAPLYLEGSSVTPTGGGVYGSYAGALPFTYQVTTTGGICPALGTASVTVTGGTAPYTYQWINAATSTVAGTSNPASLPTAEYHIAITDANGCTSGSANSYDSIFVHNEAGFNYTLASTLASCTNGTATVSAFTGTGVTPYTYLWSTGATSSSISGLSQGNYSVTVSDAQGCSRTKSKQIEQSPQIQANMTVTPATCIQNNGSIISFGSGGTPPYSYLYSNGGTTQSISGLSAGSYTVHVTDANGCTGVKTEQVSASTPITATYTATSSTCTGATGSATLTISGGAAPYVVTWSTFPAQTGVTASNLPAGTYNFHIVDVNGCIRNGAVVVPPQSVITANITATNPTCLQTNGGLAVSATGGTAPYSYAWSNSATTASIGSLPAGGYSVVVTDANGCAVTKYRNLEPTSPIVLGLVSTPASCVYANDGSIASTVSGGATPYTYSWSNGGSSSSITGLHQGNYSVHVTDANGCTANQYTGVSYNAGNNSCYCTITGTVYNDANGNCTMDAGEAGIANIQIHCSGYGYAYTNANGVYSFQVPSGSYTISQSILANYPLAACQTNGIAVTTVAASGCTQTVNFANTVTPLHDIHVSLWDYNEPVPGNSFHQTCIVSNQGTVAEANILASYHTDGQLGVPTISPSGIFASAGGGLYSTLGNTVPSLNAGGSQVYAINYNVPTNIPISTSLAFRDSAVYTAPMSGWVNDYSPWNNVNQRTSVVLSSFDPNFMQVSPQGTGPQGYITRDDSTLEYMVHFQNMGTYFAQNVVVIDTLDQNLDWKSIRPIYSSHGSKVSIDENGVLKYTFNNIQLPAQSLDDAGSNGMFTFTVKMKPNLAYGTEIRNHAGIYFDYNEPVITNEVLNTIESPTGINKNTGVNKPSFAIYPNPAKTNFVAVIDSKKANAKAILTITDISGRTLAVKDMILQAGKQNISMDTQSLMDGLYFVNLNIEGNKSTQKLVIVK